MRITLLLLAAFLWPAHAAGEPGAATDACEQASDTVSYNRCSAEQLQAAQSQMQMTFDATKAKSRDSDGALAALLASQEKWEASYRADIAARFADEDAALARGEHVGTAYTSAHNWYEARLVRARTEWLCELLSGPAYGESDPAPCGELVLRTQTIFKN
jgi:uncharacterized protein YecT (DUF1311 family)